jgi:hypothetical protein
LSCSGVIFILASNVELSREPLNGAILARRIAGISKNRDIG